MAVELKSAQTFPSFRFREQDGLRLIDEQKEEYSPYVFRFNELLKEENIDLPSVSLHTCLLAHTVNYILHVLLSLFSVPSFRYHLRRRFGIVLLSRGTQQPQEEDEVPGGDEGQG